MRSRRRSRCSSGSWTPSRATGRRCASTPTSSAGRWRSAARPWRESLRTWIRGRTIPLSSMEGNVCWGCGAAEGEGHDEEEGCVAEEHAAMRAGDNLAKELHDPEECEACLADHALNCECRCGKCCEALIIEASEFDA